MEVIVIDNGSTDGSGEMVKSRFPQVQLIQNAANVGFARAMNQGFALAGGEYAVMLNSDTMVLDRAIEKSVAFAETRPEAGIVGCRLLNPDRTFQDSCFRFPSLLGMFLTATHLSQWCGRNYVLNWDRYGLRQWGQPREVECVMGSYMLIRRGVLERVGLLDPDYFMYGEEADFACRVRKAGWKILYFPGADIIHVGHGSARDWAGRAWAYRVCLRGGLLFFCKQRGALAAVLGNIIVTCSLAPRVVVWGLADVVSSFWNRQPFQARRLLCASSFGFHLKALFRPGLLTEPWRRT
jgi:hypothetical protein